MIFEKCFSFVEADGFLFNMLIDDVLIMISDYFGDGSMMNDVL